MTKQLAFPPRSVEANPETHIPGWMYGASTKADACGLWVLCLSAECSCGYEESGVAPSWKVPMDWGGSPMTDECPDCDTIIDYDTVWRRVDRMVSEYSELKPENAIFQKEAVR